MTECSSYNHTEPYLTDRTLHFCSVTKLTQLDSTWSWHRSQCSSASGRSVGGSALLCNRKGFCILEQKGVGDGAPTFKLTIFLFGCHRAATKLSGKWDPINSSWHLCHYMNRKSISRGRTTQDGNKVSLPARCICPILRVYKGLACKVFVQHLITPLQRLECCLKRGPMLLETSPFSVEVKDWRIERVTSWGSGET